jgi:hypothetical protein
VLLQCHFDVTLLRGFVGTHCYNQEWRPRCMVGLLLQCSCAVRLLEMQSQGRTACCLKSPTRACCRAAALCRTCRFCWADVH